MKREGEFNQKVYDKLKEINGKHRFITYRKLNDACELGLDFRGKNSQQDRNRLGDILGTISRHEFDRGRPMLSAIVVMAHSHPPKPSFGFYNYAEEIGAWNPNQESKDQFYFRQLRELGYP